MSKNYIVRLPDFHVTADSPQEAVEQAVRTFLEYPSSRMCNVRQFGIEYSLEFNPNDQDHTLIHG